jgi:hypothetical protein
MNEINLGDIGDTASEDKTKAVVTALDVSADTGAAIFKDEIEQVVATSDMVAGTSSLDNSWFKK